MEKSELCVCMWWWCSVANSCPALCDPMVRSMLGFPVLHCLPQFAQTQVHWVTDAIQPSYPLMPPSPSAFNLSQHQGPFQWLSSSHQVAQSIGASAELVVFLEFLCLVYDLTNVGNLTSGSSAFSKSSLYIWNSSVHVLLKPSLKDFEHYLASKCWL